MSETKHLSEFSKLFSVGWPSVIWSRFGMTVLADVGELVQQTGIANSHQSREEGSCRFHMQIHHLLHQMGCRVTQTFEAVLECRSGSQFDMASRL